MASINCGNCGKKHASVADVRACYAGTAPASAASPASTPEPEFWTCPKCGDTREYKLRIRHETIYCKGAPAKPSSTSAPEQTGPRKVYHVDAEPTSNQIWKVGKEGGDQNYAKTLNRAECAEYIGKLMRAKAAKPTPPPPPPKVKEVLPFPENLLDQMPVGRFAVQPDSTTPLTFIRITRPTFGKYNGCLKIQTQHSEMYRNVLVKYPSGQIVVFDKRGLDELLLVYVDPNGAKIRYGQELHHCCQCGKELTDERSRYYGIGPECEKSNQQIIDITNDLRGPYVPGNS